MSPKNIFGANFVKTKDGLGKRLEYKNGQHFPPTNRGKLMTNSREDRTRQFSPRMSPQNILSANFAKKEGQSRPKPEMKKRTAFPLQEETKDIPNLDYLAQPQKRSKQAGNGQGEKERKNKKKNQTQRWSNDHLANVLKHIANAPVASILKTSVYNLPVHGVSKPLCLKGRPGGTLPRGPGEKPEPVVSQKGVGFLAPVSLICLS